MSDSLFAPHAERADFADDLVSRLEKAQQDLWSVRQDLYAQRHLGKNRLIDTFVSDPVIIGLESAQEALTKARRLLVIEAYDERRKPDDAEASDE